MEKVAAKIIIDFIAKKVTIYINITKKTCWIKQKFWIYSIIKVITNIVYIS